METNGAPGARAMNHLAKEFEAKLRAAIEAMNADDALANVVATEVEAFFARHPALVPTPGARAIATALIFERLMKPEPKEAT